MLGVRYIRSAIQYQIERNLVEFIPFIFLLTSSQTAFMWFHFRKEEESFDVLLVRALLANLWITLCSGLTPVMKGRHRAKLDSPSSARPLSLTFWQSQGYCKKHWWPAELPKGVE